MAIKIDAADRAFSNYIRERDNWTCKRCDKSYDKTNPNHRMALHCSHFQGRGKESTRFHEENADALCYGCHRYFTAHPAEHYEWQVSWKGQDKVDELVRLSNQYKKKDRKAEKEYWTARLKELEG